jgi:hypothetical protein
MRTRPGDPAGGRLSPPCVGTTLSFTDNAAVFNGSAPPCVGTTTGGPAALPPGRRLSPTCVGTTVGDRCSTVAEIVARSPGSPGVAAGAEFELVADRGGGGGDLAELRAVAAGRRPGARHAAVLGSGCSARRAAAGAELEVVADRGGGPPPHRSTPVPSSEHGALLGPVPGPADVQGAARSSRPSTCRAGRAAIGKHGGFPRRAAGDARLEVIAERRCRATDVRPVHIADLVRKLCGTSRDGAGVAVEVGRSAEAAADVEGGNVSPPPPPGPRAPPPPPRPRAPRARRPPGQPADQRHHSTTTASTPATASTPSSAPRRPAPPLRSATSTTTAASSAPRPRAR